MFVFDEVSNFSRSTGGATATAPSTWGHPDLQYYYKIHPSFTARTATRSLPASTDKSSHHHGSKVSVGAIAGGVLGGLVAIIAVLGLVLFCLHRRKAGAKEKPLVPRTPTPPVELASTPITHELSNSTSPGKYNVELAERPPKGYANYTEAALSPHSHGQDYPSSYHQIPQSSGPNSPPLSGTYHSSNHEEYGQPVPHHQDSIEQFYPTYTSTHTAPPTGWTLNTQSPHSPGAHPQGYSYPTPTSPIHQMNFPLPPQPQVYYPPPPEPSQSSSPTATHHSHESPYGHSPPLAGGHSTLTTPAQFYAQPVPIRPIGYGSAQRDADHPM